MLGQRLTTLLFLVSQLVFIRALIEKLPLPVELRRCYEFKSSNITMEDVPSKRILDFCLRTYLLDKHIHQYSANQNISENAIRYLTSLFRAVEGEMYEVEKKRKEHEKARRKKRQLLSFNSGTWRYRKEIRALSAAEWNRVTGALNRLKRDYSIDRSVSTYDMISYLHSGPALEGAHGGPNFFGYHCIYILVLETAMRVPIPYWDSSLDDAMALPATSVVWSHRFFGNGNGEVVHGPFSTWRTRLGTRLIRNVGSNTERLISKRALRLMLSRRRISEVSEPLSGVMNQYSFEGHHNGVHNYVDGHFTYLHTSTYDPIFFFHHSFMHMLWMEFKRRQRMSGIVPERDYPRGANVPTAHRWYRQMDFLPFSGRMRHIDGYSRRYDDMVRYEPMPRCSTSCGGSPYLYCDQRRQICVSRGGAMRSRLPFGGVRRVNSFGNTFGRSPVNAGLPTLQRFQLRRRVPVISRRPVLRSFHRIPFVHRGKRSVGDNLSMDPQGSTTEVIEQVEQEQPVMDTTLDRPYQNTYIINNNSDVSLWVFFPVTLIYQRPKSFKYEARVISKDQPENTTSKDMYDPQQYKSLSSHLDIDKQVNFTEVCPVHKSGAAKVYVQSDGLNYLGNFKDYAIVDERQPISSITSFIGVKKPEPKEDSHVLLTAYDSCGHACRAMCLVRDSNPTRYEFCSGTLKISTSDPMMYSATYGEAVDNMWGQNSITKGIGEPRKHTVITFVCDFKNKWPWQV